MAGTLSAVVKPIKQVIERRLFFLSTRQVIQTDLKGGELSMMTCTNVSKAWFPSRGEWLPSKEKLWSTSQRRTPCGLDVSAATRSEEKMLEALGHTSLSYIDSLLQENKSLKSQLSEAQEDIAKQRHERTHLQRILRHRNEMDEEVDRIKEEPLAKQFMTDPLRRSSICVDGEALMRKLDAKVAENAELEARVAELVIDKKVLEEEVEEWKQQVADLNQLLKSLQLLEVQMAAREEEILELREECDDQKQRICHLEICHNEGMVENEELVHHLERSKEEIVDLKRRLKEMECLYQEYRLLLEEQKAENASLRHEHKPKVLRHLSTPNSPYVARQSISSEIEESIRLRLRQRKHSEPGDEKRRVMNMIHLVSLAHGGRRRGVSDGYTLFYNLNRNSSISSDLHLGSTNSEKAETDADIISDHVNDDTLPQNIFIPLGCPGRPGSLDLEFALGYKVHLSPLQTGQLEELWQDDDDENESRMDDDCISDGCQTPRSTTSGFSSYSSHQSEKLQLVKPLEGSLTLFHWHRLSTPGLGNILEMREGIQVKGDEPGRHFEQEDHSLSDCEEDDDVTATTHNHQKSTPGITISIDQPNSDDKECSNSSTHKSHRRSERSKRAEERELFILFSATRVPLSTQDDPHREDPTQKRTGCVIA